MRINHNISALNAYRNLAVNNANTAKSLEKLSSGLRINKASDDAAGLAISEKMRSQIRGLEMAERNALDGISLIQTAEGALSSSHEILQRMRELAVQAANDSYTNTDRAEIQKEVNQLTSELNRIGNSTEFNNASLLDGTRINTFSANGKGFVGGGTSLSNGDTGLTLAITDGNELSVGKHTVSVTRELAGKAQPDPITPPNSDLFVGGRIEADTSVSADNWTLTYQEGKDASIASVEPNLTGVTVNIADGGTNLAAGEHTVNVIATPAGASTFEGGVQSYELAKSAPSDVSSNSAAGTYSFSGGKISYDTASSQTPAVGNGDTITLTYNSATASFTVDGGPIVSESYTPGTEFAEHGLNFTLTESGFTDGEKITFTVGPDAAGTINAEATPGYVGAGNLTSPLTVSNEVGTGDWTIQKSGAEYVVTFNGTDKDGNTSVFTEKVADGVNYSSHGLEFSADGLQDGESITFSTTQAVQGYNYSIDIDGTPVSVPNGATTITGFEGLSLDVTNLQAGTFKFTVDPAVADKFQLNSASGKTADAEVGKLFEGHGLSFLIDSTTGLNNGDEISFSTVDPVDGYNYYVSLDGKAPITAVENQSSPAQIVTNTDLAGLHLSSLDLNVGDFTFDVVETGTGNDGTMNFQIGANSGQTVALEINDMRAQALDVSSKNAGAKDITLENGESQKVWFTSASDVNDGVSAANTEYAVDVTTHEKAQAAITVFSDAIQQVSSERARLGSIQNRLEHTVNNLRTMTENVTSSESRIRDLDMAKEMSTFTKNNILNQAAQAMLSQANQMPQGVLQLLK